MASFFDSPPPLRLRKTTRRGLPLATDAKVVAPIRQRLHARSVTLGHAPFARRAAGDPALQISAGGRRLRLLRYGESQIAAAVPAGTREMRIASRAAAPAQMQPWLDDRRRLGVRVSRVRAAGAGPARDLPLDAPMSGGWWGVEQDAKGPFRWTTGDAILPLPGGTALVMLSVAPLASGYPTG